MKKTFLKLIILFLSFLTLCSCLTTQKLDAPIIFEENYVVRWNKITNATSYIINVNDEEIEVDKLFFDLKTLNHTRYDVKVKAINKEEKLESEYSNSIVLVYFEDDTEKLKTPVLTIKDKKLSWEQIENAEAYDIYINNIRYDTTKEINYELKLKKEGTYTIFVKATSSNKKYTESDASNSVEYIKEITTMTIAEAKEAIDENPYNDTKITIVGKVIGIDSTGYFHVADETGAIYVRSQIDYPTYYNTTVKITGYGFIYRGSYNYPEYTRQIKSDNIKIEPYTESVVTPKEVVTITKNQLMGYDEVSCMYAPFFGNVVSITGIVEVGSSKYNFYLNDEEGNHLVQIHHYSLNFNNTIDDSERNIFLKLNHKEVTLKGIIYRYYNADSIWTLQCIGLEDEVVVNFDKLLPPTISVSNQVVYWDKVDNATGYNVYVNEILVTTLGAGETEYSFENYTSGTYKVRVTSIDNTSSDLTESSLSNEVTIRVGLENSQVNIFMINDTHGAFVDGNFPGVERVSTLINSIEGNDGEYIKIANGDMFQGSYVSSILYGKPILDALNEMKFDAFIIGNHEFDWGIEKIAEYKDGNLANGEANFPFVCANIYDKKTNKLLSWLDPYTIVENNGKKVGIIGLIGHNLESSILSQNVKDYDFVYPLQIVKDLAKELRNDKKCDSVIVSIHDYDAELNQDLAKLQNDERIDAILCGHTHSNEYDTLRRSDGVNIAVVENRDKNQSASTLNLKFEGSDLTNTIMNRYYPSNYNKDTKLAKLMEKYQDTINESNRVLGTTTEYLNRSTLGMYATAAMKDEFNADISIMNTGGVRASISYGEITVASVFEVFPFNNRVYVTYLKGSAIKSLYQTNGDYLYFNEEFNSLNIDSQKTYKIAVIDYVFTGPYYTEFTGVDYEDTNKILRDLLIDYIDNLY